MYYIYMHIPSTYTYYTYINLFHFTMEISVHSVENMPRTADTVGRCDNLVYYLLMHTHT